jgi:ubiquinone/menaquinone biosynthesis C-methylase UbiE
MDPRLQLRVQRYGWDKAVEYYEPLWREQLAPATSRLLELAALHPGEYVLEVACGTGLVTLPAADAVGSTGRVLGTDISQGMVEAAAARAASRGASNVSFARADAEGLDVDEATFDVALCALGLMYVPDPVAALSRMRLALKPGGRAVQSVWGKRNHCGWAEIFPIVDARVKSEVCPMFFHLGTGDALQYAMDKAGFENVTVDRLSTILYYNNDEDALGAAFAGGPVALAYSRFDDRTRAQAHAEYLDSIAPYKKNGGYEIPGEFVVARGTR